MNSILSAIMILVCLGAAICPWVWIAFRRGTVGSAWNTPAIDRWVRYLSNNVSNVFYAHLQGRVVWLWVLVMLFGLLYMTMLVTAHAHWVAITFSFLCCWLTSVMLMTFAWFRVGKPNGVQPGLLANFFMQGGVMGALLAIVLNSSLLMSWVNLSPLCNPMTITMNAACNAEAALMWVLTPGLVEETFKAIWLFCRLRRSPDDLPGKCCFCLPAIRGFDCGCWYKLAPTPYHVILCAFASGAGFEVLENILYVFGKSGVLSSVGDTMTRTITTTVTLAAENISSSSGSEVTAATTTTLTTTSWNPLVDESPPIIMVVTAVARMPSSVMHMVWTGLIGFGLARRLFLEDARRPSLLMVLLPSMIAHGLGDYALSAMSSAEEAQKPGLPLLFFPLFLTVSVGSCFLMGRLTGCRGLFCCDESCCCAAGFWESLFGSIPDPSRADLVGQPLSEAVLQPTTHPADVSPSHQAGATDSSLRGQPMTS